MDIWTSSTSFLDSMTILRYLRPKDLKPKEPPAKNAQRRPQTKGPATPQQKTLLRPRPAAIDPAAREALHGAEANAGGGAGDHRHLAVDGIRGG